MSKGIEIQCKFHVLAKKNDKQKKILKTQDSAQWLCGVIVWETVVERLAGGEVDLE
jgi:hypothetical protein